MPDRTDDPVRAAVPGITDVELFRLAAVRPPRLI